jgi:hypothetical protein
MAISPERKILMDMSTEEEANKKLDGIITLSNIFNLLFIDN